MKAPMPPFPVQAHCWDCTRMLWDANGKPVMVPSVAQREGICNECRSQAKVYVPPGMPVGNTRDTVRVQVKMPSVITLS
jgi:hypothetical protein